jgi:SAM-dependent methyltransferase
VSRSSAADSSFSLSARIYDALYSFKDYAAESSRLHELIQARRPGARTLLDVACGTGKHLAELRAWYEVEGLDLDADLLAFARKRLPGVVLHQADMAEFELDRTFDAVTCLFSAIGYVRPEERMRAAVASMAHHVAPGGVLVVEPWFTPEMLIPDHIGSLLVELDDPPMKIARMNTVERLQDTTVMDMHHLVGTPAGVEHFVERHELGLYDDGQYRAAISDAGLEPDHDPEGLIGRGLWFGRKSRSDPL